MKKKKLRILALATLIVAGFAFASCEEDKQSEPQIGLKFNTVQTPITLNSGLKSAQETKELSFNSGFITLREIEFEVETDDDSVEVNFNMETNTKIDFATGETNPDISYAKIPTGTYNEMEVEIELQDEGDTPSVVLNGTFIDIEGVSHDIRFEFNSGETFEIEKEGTIIFETNESALAQITINPADWFAEVTALQLSEATKNDNGVIVISSTQNSEIFEIAADGLDMATDIEIEN
jgi:hypothetical protein